MDIVFNCKCKKSFSVEDEYLLKKDSLKCPNCEFEIPKKSLEYLKEGLSKILEAREFLRVPPPSNVVMAKPLYSIEFKIIDD